MAGGLYPLCRIKENISVRASERSGCFGLFRVVVAARFRGRLEAQVSPEVCLRPSLCGALDPLSPRLTTTLSLELFFYHFILWFA